MASGRSELITSTENQQLLTAEYAEAGNPRPQRKPKSLTTENTEITEKEPFSAILGARPGDLCG
jgi:hypothetical protein